MIQNSIYSKELLEIMNIINTQVVKDNIKDNNVWQNNKKLIAIDAADILRKLLTKNINKASCPL